MGSKMGRHRDPARASHETDCAQRNAIDEILKLAKAVKYRARFQERRRNLDSDKTEYSFERSWKRPELSSPPLELLEEIDKRYPVKLFELTTDNAL